MKVAVVESGPLGGTCLNRGCIPSKNVIYPADVINIIKEAGKLGIKVFALEDIKTIYNLINESLDDEMKWLWIDYSKYGT